VGQFEWPQKVVSSTTMIAGKGAVMIKAAVGPAGGMRVIGRLSQGEFEILCLAMGASDDP
jgi:hypothetical protein